MMAVRAVNNCSIFRSASSPPISAVRCRFFTFRSSSLRRHPKLGFQFPVLRPEQKFFGHGSVWSCSVHSLVDIVMEELKFMRKRKRVCAASKYVFSQLVIFIFLFTLFNLDARGALNTNCFGKSIYTSFIFINFNQLKCFYPLEFPSLNLKVMYDENGSSLQGWLNEQWKAS